MSKKSKLVIIYCALCSVLFMAGFAVLSYNKLLPGVWQTVLFAAAYCVILLFGVWFILRAGSTSQGNDAPPKSSRSVTHMLAAMKMPVALTDGGGKIVWSNEAFSAIMEGRIKKDSDFRQLTGLSLKELLAADPETGAEIKLDTRTFRVFGFPQSNSAGRTVTTLWVETTNETQLREKLENERLIVGYVVIDMADNFLSNMQDQYAEASAAVTKLLKSWAESVNGHIREYGAGKYLMMFFADQLPAMRRASFPILSEAKKITFGDDAIPMTLSIGIADCGGTVTEKCQLASSAMSFALQRGGDQVVIKNDRGTKDEFFGGLSKHDPQLTGLNARRLVLQATPLIKKAGSVFIMGHKNADFDCLASCMGIAKICLSLGKKTTLIVKNNKNIAKPYAKMLEMPDYRDIFYDFDRDDLDAVEHDSLLFIIDVNNPYIFEYPEITKHVSQIIVIDHHRMSSSSFPFETKITYVEPSASSASEIVSQMIAQFFPSGVLTPDEANLLLAGIQLDTNNFTRDCGAGTYAAAQFLRREGADASVASSFFTLDKKAFMLELKIESTMRVYRDGCVICTGDDSSPSSDPATAARVADTMLKLDGVAASFAIVRINTDVSSEPVYTISARSDGSVNVQVILERLGGGGHHSNAGTQLTAGKVVQMYEGPLPRVTSELAVGLLEQAIDASFAKDAAEDQE
ncbi:MAG: DHH family phosphoesterase [Clostridia bacterium]|nr:DHH family phosphoesterase [Clostridia bacterium]